MDIKTKVYKNIQFSFVIICENYAKIVKKTRGDEK